MAEVAWGWGEGEERQKTWLRESSGRKYVYGERNFRQAGAY